MVHQEGEQRAETHEYRGKSSKTASHIPNLMRETTEITTGMVSWIVGSEIVVCAPAKIDFRGKAKLETQARSHFSTTNHDFPMLRCSRAYGCTQIAA